MASPNHNPKLLILSISYLSRFLPQTLWTRGHDSDALTDACTRKGPQMANARPTPKPENLRPPWPPGTSGNPAGYSRGRRISDAIERLIEDMALDREFGAAAIAMALGKKYMLKRKVEFRGHHT